MELSSDRNTSARAADAIGVVERGDRTFDLAPGIAGQVLTFDERAGRYGLRLYVYSNASESDLVELASMAEQLSVVGETVLLAPGEEWPDCAGTFGCEEAASECGTFWCSLPFVG